MKIKSAHMEIRVDLETCEELLKEEQQKRYSWPVDSAAACSLWPRLREELIRVQDALMFFRASRYDDPLSKHYHRIGMLFHLRRILEVYLKLNIDERVNLHNQIGQQEIDTLSLMKNPQWDGYKESVMHVLFDLNYHISDFLAETEETLPSQEKVEELLKESIRAYFQEALAGVIPRDKIDTVDILIKYDPKTSIED